MKRPGRKPQTRRNRKILALRGKLSYALIAERLGLTPGTVSGVCFRADYPLLMRRHRSGTHNKIGTGHCGGGNYARRTRKIGRPAGAHPSSDGA